MFDEQAEIAERLTQLAGELYPHDAELLRDATTRLWGCQGHCD